MKHSAVVLLTSLLALSAGCAIAKTPHAFTLKDVQGFWWERCDDPAVQFAIQQDRFSGDFEGEFKVRVDQNTLSIEQLHKPALEYRILAASPRRLVLRTLHEATSGDWVLRTCADTSAYRH